MPLSPTDSHKAFLLAYDGVPVHGAGLLHTYVTSRIVPMFEGRGTRRSGTRFTGSGASGHASGGTGWAGNARSRGARRNL